MSNDRYRFHRSTDSDPRSTFQSPQEEIEYWKQLYKEKSTELDEFVSSSKELEEELEAELKSKEDSVRELQDAVQKLTNELKDHKVSCCLFVSLTFWQESARQASSQSSAQILQLQVQCADVNLLIL